VDEPIAKVVRRAKNQVYVSEPFVNHIKELLKEKKLTYREAALDAGLDHQGIRRILAGQQPSLTNCILLQYLRQLGASGWLKNRVNSAQTGNLLKNVSQ
jgi:predicted transcriptional regulator